MKSNKAKRGYETAAEAYKDISWQDTIHFYGPKYNKIMIHYWLVKSGEDIEVILKRYKLRIGCNWIRGRQASTDTSSAVRGKPHQ